MELDSGEINSNSNSFEINWIDREWDMKENIGITKPTDLSSCATDSTRVIWNCSNCTFKWECSLADRYNGVVCYNCSTNTLLQKLSTDQDMMEIVHTWYCFICNEVWENFTPDLPKCPFPHPVPHTAITQLRRAINPKDEDDEFFTQVMKQSDEEFERYKKSFT